jgi:hypothetical protein
VSGGINNKAWGMGASVSGGGNNTAGWYQSSVSGGINNTSFQDSTSISGGSSLLENAPQGWSAGGNATPAFSSP